MFQAAPNIGGHARQLWRLNREGLLLTALNRSGGHSITKTTAFDLIADS